MRPIDEIRRNTKLTCVKSPIGVVSGYITLSTGAKGSFIAGLIEDGGNTEHVSVCLYRKKLPTWDEMCEVKEIFWDDEEEAIQIHPRKSEYVNNIEALHLWRAANGDWNRLMEKGR